MAQPIQMPKFGQTVEEATIVKWRKKAGDVVKKGDVLFEIETDKAVLEVESFHEGTLLKVLVPENKSVPVLSVVAYVGKEGESVPDAPPIVSSAPKTETPKAENAKKLKSDSKSPAPSVSAPSQRQEQLKAVPQRLFASPRAKTLAKDCAIDISKVAGSGANGRVTEKDVKSYLENNSYDLIKITPAAKKLAIAKDIDILSIKGTGISGRITEENIRTAIAEKPIKMSKMRQVIAQRLTESFTTTPHFYVSTSVDMTDLMIYRVKLKEQGKAFTVTDFIFKAVIMSLKEFPAVNSVTDGESTSWRSTVDIGMAVALDDGLVVPVIRNAENLTITDLHDTAKALAKKARAGQLLPDEMTGSSFTVSNMGMLDVDNFHAIINPGESAILAVASTREKPAARGGKVEIRSIMNITLSVDHRIVDGKTAAAFVNSIKNKLENMELWKSLIS